MEVKTADKYVDIARDLLTGSRQSQNGDKIRNHENIGRLWEAYLKSRDLMNHDDKLLASDVSRLMVLLKIARSVYGNYNEDDYVDMIGYAAISGEITGSENA